MFLVAPYARDADTGGWASCWTSPRPEKAVLGRLVALAAASAASIIEWLSGKGQLGENPSGWQNAFRCYLLTR